MIKIKEERKEYKAIWLSPELHQRYKNRAEKNDRTITSEMKVLLDYLEFLESERN